jgi:hypothetical protein
MVRERERERARLCSLWARLDDVVHMELKEIQRVFLANKGSVTAPLERDKKGVQALGQKE